MKILLFAALLGLGACTSITVSGDHNTVSTTTMVNGNSATVPVSGLPGVP